MKISDTGSPVNELVTKYKIHEKKMNTGQGRQVENGVNAEEKVSLSPAARDIQRAEQALRELPDVREEKIEELKQRIEAGEYEIKGDRIAEKILSESLMDVMDQ